MFNLAGIYRLDINGNAESVFKLKQMPKDIADTANKELKGVTGMKVMRNVKTGMPVSKRTKTHMKTADSLQLKMQKGVGSYRNFGVLVAPTKQYWYMKFPNNGTSTSSRKGARRFVQIGLTKSKSLINATIQRAVSKSTRKI